MTHDGRESVSHSTEGRRAQRSYRCQTAHDIPEYAQQQTNDIISSYHTILSAASTCMNNVNKFMIKLLLSIRDVPNCGFRLFSRIRIVL